MNAPLASLTRDPIGVLLPDCVDPAEREARRRLLIARDIASAKISHLPPGHSLQLHWIIIETASAAVFAPASVEELEDLVRYVRRLMLCAGFAQRRETPFEDE